MSYIADFVNRSFSTTTSKDFFYFVCGKWIGGGAGRDVFEYTPDPTCVIKIESNEGSFQNILEWDLWQQHSRANTSTAKWLAPCLRISDCGIVLIQKRTKPVPFGWLLPKRVPNILCSDMKRENWGVFKGRLVCHDYGRHDAVRWASTGANMAKSEWLYAEKGHFKPALGDEGATNLII